MQRLASLLGSVWLVVTGCAGAPRVVPTPAPSSLSVAQEAQLRRLLASVPGGGFGRGASLSLSLGGRRLTIVEGVRFEGGPAVEADTTFNVASVSKLATAAVVHLLVREGRLGLDDTVAMHLPEVRLLDSSGRNRAGEISLGQLLAHRGGLPHQPGTLDPTAVGSAWDDPALLAKLTATWTLSLAREPGGYGYSNVGYVLLAAIVERHAEADFASAAEPRLRQVGMRAAGFLGDEASAARGQVERDGRAESLAPSWYASRYALPFSGLWASTPDLVVLGEALLTAAGDETAALYPMVVREGSQGHGLGPVHRQRHGAWTLEHDGGGPGFTAWLVVVPERQLVFAIACNGDGESARARAFVAWVDEMLAVLLGEAGGT